MNFDDYNLKALEATYKNARLAIDSISDIISSVKNEELKKEILSQNEGYQKFLGEITKFMTENSIEISKINPFQKAMMWSSIKIKTLFDDSKNNIAEMMIKGTTVGINELTAMQNESSNLEPEIKDFVSKLLTLEEKYNENLKEFL